MSTPIRRQAILAGAAVLLLVTGCGGSGPDSSAGTATTAAATNVAASMRAVSACLRTHGYPNFPDPVQDDQGNWSWPPSVDGMHVSTGCDDLVRRAKSLNRKADPEKVSSADLAKLRAYAACIRQHGLADWPDPRSDGSFLVPQRLSPPQGDALVRPAAQACDRLSPGAIRIQSAGSGKG
jgi:hypothetical protein